MYKLAGVVYVRGSSCTLFSSIYTHSAVKLDKVRS
jgi:hypothetical protein